MALRAARAATPATLKRTVDGGEYRTTWLQADCAAAFSTAPYRMAIKKLVDMMYEADRMEGWGLLHAEKCSVRCIEFHEYDASRADPNCSMRGRAGITTGAASPTHFDSGSLVTLDLMLSPATAFDGGAFTTPEADGTTTVHDFQRGTAVVFVAHKYHHVLPMTRGLREVLVIELWSGPERHCPHRCLLVKGDCDYTNERQHGEDADDDELLPFVA